MDDHGHDDLPLTITPDALGGGRISWSGLQVHDGWAWWSQSDPSQGGRQVVYRVRIPTEHYAEVAPAVQVGRPSSSSPLPRSVERMSPVGVSVRTSVHGYGGGAWTVDEQGVLVYVDSAGGMVFELCAGMGESGSLHRLSPEPRGGTTTVYGDLSPVPGGTWVLAVRERHSRESRGVSVVEDAVVAIGRPAFDASESLASVELELCTGHDFHGAPRAQMSPIDGVLRMAWLVWDLPDMPWDSSELWVGELRLPAESSPLEPAESSPLATAHEGPFVVEAARVSGGRGESVGQPRWEVDGSLTFVSDQGGFWRPWNWAPGGDARRITDAPYEFHGPDWALGQKTLDRIGRDCVVGRLRRDGRDRLALVSTLSGEVVEVDQPIVTIQALSRADDKSVVVVGATETEPTAIYLVGGLCGVGGDEVCSVQRLWSPTLAMVSPEVVARPEFMEIPLGAQRIGNLGSPILEAAHRGVVGLDPANQQALRPPPSAACLEDGSLIQPPYPLIPLPTRSREVGATATGEMQASSTFGGDSTAGPGARGGGEPMLRMLFYRPTQAAVRSMVHPSLVPSLVSRHLAADALPPLLVVVHGGPTGAVEPGFDPMVQFWTGRGVAVAAVDYRGSTGYGREFREMLDGGWGLFDAQDCTAAAQYLAAAGLVDPTRMAIRGSSAGGLTALNAATVGGAFTAAIVAYGVTDLEALVADTHKFESGYTDRLVGVLPDAADIYDDRSPARHPERIGAAVLLLQGEDDPIVPPSQAAAMAASLATRGVECEHVVFAGEGHGFRAAVTIAQVARREVAFLSRVWDLELERAPIGKLDQGAGHPGK